MMPRPAAIVALVAALWCATRAAAAPSPATPDELYSQGEQALAAGQSEQAASLYKQALEVDTKHWPSLCRLGEMDAAARRYADAERRLRLAVEINPQSGRCLSRLAQVLLVEEKTAEAEPFLMRAAELLPSDEGVIFNLARLYETSERLDAALETWKRYLAAAPGSARAPGVHLKVARILAKALLPLDAVEHYSAFLESQPDKHDVRAEMAQALMAASKYPESAAEYDKVIASGTANAAALANAGGVHLLLRNLPRALELLDKAVSADPAPIAPRIGLATALAQTGDHARAVEVLRALTAEDPGNNRAWFLLAQSLMKLGRAEEARAALERHRAIHEQIMKERMEGEPEGHPP